MGSGSEGRSGKGLRQAVEVKRQHSCFSRPTTGWNKRALTLMQRTATTLPAESEAGFQRQGCNWSGCSGDGSQRLCSATLSLTVIQLESSPPHLATSLPSQDISECLFRFQGPRSLGFCVPRLPLSPVSALYLCMRSAHCQSARHCATPLTLDS